METYQKARNFEEAAGLASRIRAGQPVAFGSLGEHCVLCTTRSQHPSQGKLVRVVRGEVFDVAVDFCVAAGRLFGRWIPGVYLSEENKRQLWVPEGFAHGFLVAQRDRGFSLQMQQPSTARPNTSAACCGVILN